MLSKTPRKKIITGPNYTLFVKITAKLERLSYIDEATLKELNANKDLRTETYGNTYLHIAIAKNYLTAAILLIEWDTQRNHLNLKDTFPTSQSTPLIFAAKTHANLVLFKLIAYGVELNEQDYRGFTALHYVCIYRNILAIRALLQAGARFDLRTKNFSAWGYFYNSNKLLPYHYYKMDITEKNLEYPHGVTAGQLNDYGDWDESYYGTKKKSLSAIRWFIAYIILNKNIPLTENELNPSQIYQTSLSFEHLRDVRTMEGKEAECRDARSEKVQNRERNSIEKIDTPVKDEFTYRQLIKLFCAKRLPLQPSILKKLKI